jgi:hypothetical protein
MAAEEPFDAAPLPDEAWWTSELHRNEKLMDKFMAVLGDNPDWEKLPWTDEEDVTPAVRAEEDDNPFASEPQPVSAAGVLDEAAPESAEDDSADEDDPDEDPEVNADFPGVSKMAREFACAVFDLEPPPPNAELLYLSAGKIGANLAGGHGLGYDEEFICGNIVKCRWALSDCEFCREMLEQLHAQTGEATYAKLIEDTRRIAEVLRERIARLRQRVWWQNGK